MQMLIQGTNICRQMSSKFLHSSCSRTITISLAKRKCVTIKLNNRVRKNNYKWRGCSPQTLSIFTTFPSTVKVKYHSPVKSCSITIICFMGHCYVIRLFTLMNSTSKFLWQLYVCGIHHGHLFLVHDHMLSLACKPCSLHFTPSISLLKTVRGTTWFWKRYLKNTSFLFCFVFFFFFFLWVNNYFFSYRIINSFQR